MLLGFDLEAGRNLTLRQGMGCAVPVLHVAAALTRHDNRESSVGHFRRLTIAGAAPWAIRIRPCGARCGALGHGRFALERFAERERTRPARLAAGRRYVDQ
jgi:hypothetical protein